MALFRVFAGLAICVHHYRPLVHLTNIQLRQLWDQIHKIWLTRIHFRCFVIPSYQQVSTLFKGIQDLFSIIRLSEYGRIKDDTMITNICHETDNEILLLNASSACSVSENLMEIWNSDKLICIKCHPQVQQYDP